MSDLKKQLIKLAFDNPNLRKDLLPLLNKVAKPVHDVSTFTSAFLEELTNRRFKWLLNATLDRGRVKLQTEDFDEFGKVVPRSEKTWFVSFRETKENWFLMEKSYASWDQSRMLSSNIGKYNNVGDAVDAFLKHFDAYLYVKKYNRDSRQEDAKLEAGGRPTFNHTDMMASARALVPQLERIRGVVKTSISPSSSKDGSSIQVKTIDGSTWSLHLSWDTKGGGTSKKRGTYSVGFFNEKKDEWRKYYAQDLIRETSPQRIYNDSLRHVVLLDTPPKSLTLVVKDFRQMLSTFFSEMPEGELDRQKNERLKKELFHRTQEKKFYDTLKVAEKLLSSVNGSMSPKQFWKVSSNFQTVSWGNGPGVGNALLSIVIAMPEGDSHTEADKALKQLNARAEGILASAVEKIVLNTARKAGLTDPMFEINYSAVETKGDRRFKALLFCEGARPRDYSRHASYGLVLGKKDVSRDTANALKKFVAAFGGLTDVTTKIPMHPMVGITIYYPLLSGEMYKGTIKTDS